MAADSEVPTPSPPKGKGAKLNKGLSKIIDENPNINGTRAQMFRDCITKLAIDKIHQAAIGDKNPSLVLDLQVNTNAQNIYYQKKDSSPRNGLTSDSDLLGGSPLKGINGKYRTPSIR